MGIIIEGEIVEHDNTEKLQDFYRCSFDVFADNVSAFLVTQVAIFEIAATIGIGQSGKRSESVLTVLLLVGHKL